MKTLEALEIIIFPALAAMWIFNGAGLIMYYFIVQRVFISIWISICMINMALLFAISLMDNEMVNWISDSLADRARIVLWLGILFASIFLTREMAKTLFNELKGN